MRAFNPRKNFLRAGRIARLEPLEKRLLLTTSRGIEPAEFDAVKADWPGFDYSGIVAESVLVVDATNGLDAKTLRRAIEDAKANKGADLIVVRTGFDAATLRFSSSDDVFKIDDASPLTIVAIGPQKLTIDANANSRIFEISDVSELSLGAVELIGGAADDGGAVLNSGTLFLDGVYIASNVASGDGGGIYNEANLTVVNSIITDNRAGKNGGGVCSRGCYVADAPLSKVNFTACDVVGNAAGADGTGFGGGIYFAGQDAGFNIFAEMRLDASIVVQNSSSSTDCDVNIYNSAFYNEIEFDGEQYVVEIPVSALIDGDYNLTTFVYWVSSYNPSNPSASGTNQIYSEATPLFVRDYDFETRSIGDYSLYESELSQAIDRAPFSAVVYPNGRALVRDFAGGRRVQNGLIDAGALEVQTTQVDLATKDGARASVAATVVGGKLRIEGIEASNLSDEEIADFKLRFFASEDLAFDETDVVVGELDALRLVPNSTQMFISDDLATELLTPGVSYYFYWRIISDSDDNDANNIGVTTDAVVFYAEDDSEIALVPFEFENYCARRDSMFYLSVSQTVRERFDSGGFAYWWDYGDGRFVRGAAGDWILPPLDGDSGVSVIALKIVDEATGAVVAKGNVALETIWTAPSISCDVRRAGDSTLILSFALQGSANRAISEWRVAWGDGTTSTFNVLGSTLTVGRLYETTEAKKYSVSLTVVEAGSQGRSTTYQILDFEVAGMNANAAVMENYVAAINRNICVSTATSERGAFLTSETKSVDEAKGSSCERTRETSWPAAVDAAFKFWKRRRENESIFDESDADWENALDCLALSSLR